MARSKGFVNNAKSGTRALTARQAQQAARGRIERQRPPMAATKPRPEQPRRVPHRSASTGAIEVEHDPTAQRLAQLGVLDWPIWSKEPSTFPWSYDAPETCYLLAGEVTVTPAGGDPVRLRPGDLARFPAGLACTWHVEAAVRKHYRSG